MTSGLIETPPRGVARGHLQVASPDHWFKLVAVFPGIAVAMALNHVSLSAEVIAESTVGLVALAMIASSNQLLDKMVDASYDGFHLLQRHRPLSRGYMSIGWLALAFLGLVVAWTVSTSFAATLAAFGAMGCIHNAPPLRSKDIPYVDVLTVALNTPIVLLAGWFIVSPSKIAPWALLLSCWMASCYCVAVRRYAEYQHSKAGDRVPLHTDSLVDFMSDRLLVSVMFFSCASALFFAAFAVRHRPELLLSFPLIGWVMAAYFRLYARPTDDVGHAEALYRGRFHSALAGCLVVMGICMLIHMPRLQQVFSPMAIRLEHIVPRIHGEASHTRG